MNIPKYPLFSFTIFFDLEDIIFENFKVSENNIISDELGKVLRYCCVHGQSLYGKCKESVKSQIVGAVPY